MDIFYVPAKEHRVCIYTKEGELVERSRFRDLLQILNDIDGLQPHRSYRVQTHAILHLEGDADRLKIVLTNGDKIAVARKRRSEIEDWAKEKTLLIRALD
ncbi:MAG: LytTR family DNA-binding domain-containing protein [Paracoccaceae bacterium]